MAKYEVTYGCGHIGTVNLFGKLAEREKKIDFMSQFGLCQECLEKAQQESRKRDYEKAVEKNTALGLLELS